MDDITEELPPVPSEFTNEYVYEVFNILKKKNSSPIDKLSNYLSRSLETLYENVALTALKTKLYRLITDVKRKGGKGRKVLLQKPFVIPLHVVKTTSDFADHIKTKVEKNLIRDLSFQLNEANDDRVKKNFNIDKLRKEKKALQRKVRSEKIKTKKTKDKSQNNQASNLFQIKRQLSIRNFDMKRQIERMERELKEKENVIQFMNNEQKIKDTDFPKSMHAAKEKLEQLEQSVNTLKAKNKDLEEENDYVRNLIQDNNLLELYDETSNQFTADTIECVMNLQNNNISASKIGEVIRTVCSLCKRQPNRVPSATTVNRISDMKLSIATKQVEDLSKKSNLTLYSDETSKFGKSFEVFAVTDEDKHSYLLGLREMSCKSSETVLETFKDILQDFNELCDGNDVGFKVLTGIKNTMSDRASTEKKFQNLLENYRTTILTTIIDGWPMLTEEERAASSRMNNFFCSLHLLVNFATVCGEGLKKFESLYLKDHPIQTDDESEIESVTESGTIRLLRTSAKSFSRGVDEKNGVYKQFNTYLLMKKEDHVKFIRFTHNRFNVFFLLGHVTYFHRENIKHFLHSFQGCTNRLLSSVYQDICNPLLVAGSRALGIISKIITGPLWRNIECKTHILDINDTLTGLRSFLAEAKDDCSEVVTGKHVPFPEESCKIENDIVMAELFKPDETDVMTIQVLQALFSCMLNLLDRQAADHLPGGKYFSKPTDISAESKSVLKHNKLPEFFFGQLDFLLRYRPNASLLCNEAYLLYSHNKTDEWLQSLDDVMRIQLINDSRKEGKNIRLKFKERLKTIEEKRLATLKLKEKEISEKKKRVLKKKETFTNDILFFGLWQSREDIKLKLEEIPSNAEKKKALKSQLNFRKNVLLQKSDKSYFLFSSKKIQKTIPELTEQLCKLVDESKSVATVESTSSSQVSLLVGKTIRHKFAEGTFIGNVISVVPGFGKWYNVTYDGDPAVYVYQLQEDYADGNIEIVVRWYTAHAVTVVTFQFN
ncbi:uncharacterized protein LOC134697357 [Mytilus trossulus]|uniref:uncharacterized protein LOC134697357 n=1 Tax=Mytilus trossulus TaxID=6551 RepID=UPI0030054F99